MKIKGNVYKYVAIGLIILGVIVFVISILLFPWKEPSFFGVRSDQLDHFGSFAGAIIGGVFSLASVFLIIQTLNEQDSDHRINQIENRFFQLLNMHKENVTTMSLHRRGGRKVFIRLIKELEILLAFINTFAENNKLELTDADKIGIGYETFFFGVKGDVSESILKLRLERYNITFKDINNLFFFFGRETR